MRVLVEDKNRAMIHYYFPRVYGYIDHAIFSQGNLIVFPSKKYYEGEEATKLKIEPTKVTQNSFIYGVTSLLKTDNKTPTDKSIEEINDEYNKQIKRTPNNSNKVLVHCAMGVSRSSSIVIMYLMKRFNITFESVIFQLILRLYHLLDQDEKLLSLMMVLRNSSYNLRTLTIILYIYFVYVRRLILIVIGGFLS